MEFLRLGSSIPGGYWGCCAICIIQNFKYDPDEKASIQLVDGDGGSPLTNNKGLMFAGKTYREIFWQRIRYGTFGTIDMPNHAFIATLTQAQITGDVGKKWLGVLKEAGFEFLRTVDNSVYSGNRLIEKPGQGTTSAHPNYIFGLFRNIGRGAVKDPFTPPKEWTNLPSVVSEAWQWMSDSGDEQSRANGVSELMIRQQEAQLKLWNDLPPKVFFSEEELTADKVPIIYAGMRSKFPQQTKEIRNAMKESLKKVSGISGYADPFAAVEVPFPIEDEEESYDEYGCDCCDGCGCEECECDVWL